jgi:hypothetical protein
VPIPQVSATDSSGAGPRSGPAQMTTITSVGYGDRYPLMLTGRVLAGGLMIIGVASHESPAVVPACPA